MGEQMTDLITGLTTDGDLKSTRGPHIAFCCIDGAVKSAVINGLKRLPSFSDAHIPQQPHFSNVDRLARLKLFQAAAPQSHRKEAFEVELRWAEALDMCMHYEKVITPLSAGESLLFLDWSVPCFLASPHFLPGVNPSLNHLLRRLPMPDFTVYIDVKVNEALRRMNTTTDPEREELSRLLHLLYQTFPPVLERLPCPILHVRDEKGADVLNVVRENLETFLAQWARPRAAKDAARQPARCGATDVIGDVWAATLPWKFPEFHTSQTAALPQRHAKIIALCGLDGSGKSSLVERLHHDPRFSNAVCVSKRLRENVDSVIQAYSDTEHVPGEYLQGPFAEVIRWAYAFDFLRFYEEEVLPHLERDVLIVSDRWSACSITYAEAGVCLGDEIYELLNCVLPPDLTIYLDVPPEEAVRRIVRRGDQNENEHMDILRGCADAYESWWPKLSSPEARVERVINDDFESAYRRVVTLIEQIWP